MANAHASEQRPIRPSGRMLEDVVKLLEPEGGSFGLSYNPEREEWMAAIEWGREVPDSPMVGAAAYGIDAVPAAAVETALREAGV